MLCLLVSGLLLGRATTTPKASDPPASTTTDLRFKTHDGHPLFGKLILPSSGQPRIIVIAVQTAEGSTVDTKRQLGMDRTFNYYDLYREKLPPMRIGFFSYEGRGITMGEKPPRFETIDWDVYNTSTLENKVLDIGAAIAAVRAQPGLAKVPIFLLGASEGTLLAAQAAARQPDVVQGLVLYGVMGANMREVFTYILSDGAFLAYRKNFDADHDGKVTKAEYEAVPTRSRPGTLGAQSFAALDRDKDGVLTVADIMAQTRPLLDAVKNDNFALLGLWARNSAAVATPKDWFKNHFAQEPIWTSLAKLDIPVGCFHGAMDANTPIGPVKKLEEQAKAAGKTKMQFHYFDDLDHSLGIGAWFARGTLPAGHKAMFKFIDEQAGK